MSRGGDLRVQPRVTADRNASRVQGRAFPQNRGAGFARRAGVRLFCKQVIDFRRGQVHLQRRVDTGAKCARDVAIIDLPLMRQLTWRNQRVGLS